MEVFEAFKKDLIEVFNIEPVINIDDDVKYISFALDDKRHRMKAIESLGQGTY